MKKYQKVEKYANIPHVKNRALIAHGFKENRVLTAHGFLCYDDILGEFMERDVLKQVIADQREYKPPKVFFDRTITKNILHFVDDPSIIIVSGIRRSGKSTIQRLLQLELAKSDYYLNFDDERLIHFQVIPDVFQKLAFRARQNPGDQRS